MIFNQLFLPSTLLESLILAAVVSSDSDFVWSPFKLLLCSATYEI